MDKYVCTATYMQHSLSDPLLFICMTTLFMSFQSVCVDTEFNLQKCYDRDSKELMFYDKTIPSGIFTLLFNNTGDTNYIITTIKCLSSIIFMNTAYLRNTHIQIATTNNHTTLNDIAIIPLNLVAGALYNRHAIIPLGYAILPVSRPCDTSSNRAAFSVQYNKN
uniref:Uncharacterized protein n=1 Tax=Ranid herpesvirus 4 TaxID=2849006 RepID=A0A8F3HTF4_9VIRU|nr:MAG: hypothetical protein [Ranid herpesvirus 4]